MSKARDLSNFISDATVDASEIADLAVTHAKLHTDMNLSSKTLTFAANQISGNAIDGGVISNFASTGIDDNATDTIITVQQNGMVGIGIDGPGARLTLGGTAGAADNSSVILIALGATQKTYFGTANAAGNIITGSSLGDTVLRSNAHNILFSVDSGSSSAVYIKSDGNVGIGTSSPTVPLHAVSSSTAIARFEGSNSGNLYITNDSNNVMTLQGSTSTALAFNTGGGNERMRIDASGNVGIGISPTHLLHVQAGSTGNGDVKIGGGAGLLISHNNSGATVQTIKSLYHATSASSNLRIVTGFLTVSTGTSDTERLRLKSNGSFEIGYAGAGLQQADNQAMTITTPASGGGQGIAIKRLDSNSDQQIGEITFSNNTQDGQAGIRVKTQGAVNTTDIHFDVNNAGTAVTSALKIDGSQGGKIAIVSREMSIQGMELRHGTFGIGNYNRRVEIQLQNYESAHVRIMAQRTNGGSCFVYWEGYINNNNNASYQTAVASRASDGSVSFSTSISGEYFRWDFNATGSSGDGSFVVQGARGGAGINVTTW